MGLFDSDFDEANVVLPHCSKGATISTCGEYRYQLTRIWDAGKPRCGWILLNPSIADAEVDDPTIRRCIGFARSWGCGSIEVANLFAYRATQPVALMETDNPVGPDNDAAIRAVAGRCEILIAAWGAMSLARGREAWVVAMLADLRAKQPSLPPLECLGVTKDGRPRHPLYLKAETERMPYQPVLVETQ